MKILKKVWGNKIYKKEKISVGATTAAYLNNLWFQRNKIFIDYQTISIEKSDLNRERFWKLKEVLDKAGSRTKSQRGCKIFRGVHFFNT